MKRSDDLERLDDYVRGASADTEANAFEEDLFARALAGEARELVAYDWLVSTFRVLGDRGTFMNFIVAKDAEAMRQRYGDRLHYLEVPANKTNVTRQTIVLPSSQELLLTKTAIDLRGVERIDVEAIVEGFGTVKVMPDITFDPEANAVYGCCEMELARQTAGMPILSKYWGHDRDGRRLLGEVLAIVELG